MIYWAPFLHFYQPPTQFNHILEKIFNESYRPLLEILLQQKNSKITVNINGALTEQLYYHAGNDILNNFKKLIAEEKIEFVESGKYHPILPLISPKEIRRQINLNRQTNSHYLGNQYSTKGFFSPEMCYSNELASMLSTIGYEWTLISGVACSEAWPLDNIHKIPYGKNNLIIFYRDDILSNEISFCNINAEIFIQKLIDAYINNKYKDIYIITAMDAETFGHHIKNWEKEFLLKTLQIIENKDYKPLAKEKKHNPIYQKQDIEIKIVTISELIDKFPVKKAIPPKPSSWSTTKQDIEHKNYYPLWKDKDNKIHILQWQHIELCENLLTSAAELHDNQESKLFFEIARNIMDKAFYSCQFWWANKTRMWDINLINKGLILQEEVAFNALKSIHTSKHGKPKKKENTKKFNQSRKIANKIRKILTEIK